MREIKFRAWDGEELIYPNTKMFGGTSNGDLLRDWPSTIMQFTGLSDKSGKEIYEGDIVETVYTNHKKHKGAIYFQPTRLNWSVEHSPFANQDLFVYSRPDCSIEIIGNIYENPELIEGSV